MTFARLFQARPLLSMSFKRHMQRHEKPKLEPVGPLRYPECDKSFEIKKYLTAHRKTHEKGIAKEQT